MHKVETKEPTAEGKTIQRAIPGELPRLLDAQSGEMIYRLLSLRPRFHPMHCHTVYLYLPFKQPRAAL
jgi:hypothetical protein